MWQNLIIYICIYNMYLYIYIVKIYIYINYTYIHIYKYRDATFCGFRHWLGRFQVCSGGHWLPIKESNRLKLVMFISFTTWRCPKLGYPEIGNFKRMFHDINHPAILGYNSQPYPRKVASLLAKPVTTFCWEGRDWRSLPPEPPDAV